MNLVLAYRPKLLSGRWCTAPEQCWFWIIPPLTVCMENLKHSFHI